MRYSRAFIHTTRDVPKEATMVSHVLLLRAGCVRMLSKGVYSYLPLGWRAVGNVSRVVRQEMDRAGAQEILMPFVQPASIWQESGRWDGFGPELLRFRNREGGDYAIGPTHEEVVTDIVRRDVRSYRQLGFNLYQIQTKYRDEPRPRAGILRGREFIMKDAYSFDADADAARRSYEGMVVTYARIMARLGFEFRAVQADTGAIGGDLSHEFQVTTPSGEDVLVLCAACAYGRSWTCEPGRREGGSPEKVPTPGMHTVEEVSGFLGVAPELVLKTVILHDGERFHAALVRGDRELNLLKTSKVLGVREVTLAGDEDVRRITGAEVGFAGPVGLEGKVATFIADREVEAMAGFVCGANRTDMHLMDVHLGDIRAVVRFADLRKVVMGDGCPRCGSTVHTERGIEGGQTFYLGTIYSGKMDATFLDDAGQRKPIEMGCYGIGITRLVAAAIEQHHDDRGIVWPVEVAPYQVEVLALGSDGAVASTASGIHDGLEAAGLDVLVDDRQERPGVKFFDADLIGAPVRIVVGEKGIGKGTVELKSRDGTLAEDVEPARASSRALEVVEGMRREAMDRAAERASTILHETGLHK
jgi:prolyl-tRNA synthetase